MGVIEWREKPTYAGEILQVGSFGGVDVCSVVCRADQWSLLLFHSFPGGQGRIWDAPVPCFSQEDAQQLAENALEEFLEEIGFVPKAAFDEVRRSAREIISEMATSKIAVTCAFNLAKERMDEVDRLERILKKIRREIDRESNRDIYGRVMKIVNDAHAWAKDAAHKQRTEADFRNADIDQRGYVTFTDGGAPDGWQLVPVEPTFEMAKAAIHLDPKCDLDAKYRAMLVAAPRYVGGEA